MNNWNEILFNYDMGNSQIRIDPRQTERAVVCFKRVLAIYSQSGNLGWALEKQKSYARAEKFYRIAYIRNELLEIAFSWGLCLSKLKKYKQASEKIQIVMNSPYGSRFQRRLPYELGKVLFHQHLYQQALEILQKDALKKRSPKEQQDQYQEALFYVGDFKKALEIALYILKKNSEDPTANNIRGLLFLIEGHEEDAVKCFEKAVDGNREYTYAWVNRSMMLLQQGKEKEAMEMLKKGVDFIEEGVNEKGEIQEIIGHYKHLSDLLEKKSLLMRYEKEKTGLEKTSSMMRLVIEYLEKPNLDNILDSICFEGAEKLEDENLDNKTSNKNEGIFERNMD